MENTIVNKLEVNDLIIFCYTFIKSILYYLSI